MGNDGRLIIVIDNDAMQRMMGAISEYGPDTSSEIVLYEILKIIEEASDLRSWHDGTVKTHDVAVGK